MLQQFQNKLFILFACLFSASVLCRESMEVTHKPEICERKSEIGDMLVVHYNGSIVESSNATEIGSEFDNSSKKGKPFPFYLGARQAIKGWDKFLVDMCKGEKRSLILPPELAFGLRRKVIMEYGAISPGSVVKFDVELVDLMDGAKVEVIYKPTNCERKSSLGDKLTMHYNGSIADNSASGEPGKLFDSTISRGEPFSFMIGSKQVIAGWDAYLLDMCLGEKRKLVLPPILAYGDEGIENIIPKGASLKFDIELVGIKDIKEDAIMKVFFKPDVCERKSTVGDKLSIHYTGYIDESSKAGKVGEIFDSSYKLDKPLEFIMGGRQVIAGLEALLRNMCVGEKRTLIIPPEMAYGDVGVDGGGVTIPGGATLKFDVELLSLSEATEADYVTETKENNVFSEIDKNLDGGLSKDEVSYWFNEIHNTTVPATIWDEEDKDKDGLISWDEFTGPKGSSKPAVNDVKNEL